jgi:hypothetical protein
LKCKALCSAQHDPNACTLYCCCLVHVYWYVPSSILLALMTTILAASISASEPHWPSRCNVQAAHARSACSELHVVPVLRVPEPSSPLLTRSVYYAQSGVFSPGAYAPCQQDRPAQCYSCCELIWCYSTGGITVQSMQRIWYHTAAASTVYAFVCNDAGCCDGAAELLSELM